MEATNPTAALVASPSDDNGDAPMMATPLLLDKESNVRQTLQESVFQTVEMQQYHKELGTETFGPMDKRPTPRFDLRARPDNNVVKELERISTTIDPWSLAEVYASWAAPRSRDGSSHAAVVTGVAPASWHAAGKRARQTFNEEVGAPTEKLTKVCETEGLMQRVIHLGTKQNADYNYRVQLAKELAVPQADAPVILTAEDALRQAEAEGLTLQPSNNKTGFKGVIFDVAQAAGGAAARGKPYRARSFDSNVYVTLGNYATAEEAALCCARHDTFASVRAASESLCVRSTRARGMKR